MQIKSTLNGYGFDCSTMGKEIKAPSLKGKDFIEFEKEWASGGHCFISILTPRDRSANGKLALPSPWVVTEFGLQYKSDRPHLVFVEEGVDSVALYGEMDDNHIVDFNLVNKRVLFDEDNHKKIIQFRKECATHETTNKLEGVGQFIFLGLAFYGGLKFLDDLFGE
ncbi:MAG: hypothetical protein ACJ71M_09110 [Nitrososphaeraceae archaeon]